MGVQKKIILADDNKTFLMYVGLLLKRFGMKVFPATNGFEVLRMMKAMPTDLIILDVHMGTFDGMATLRHIKTDRDQGQIPVIMISQDMSPETVDRCRGLGCSDYLFKPINVDRLHESVQKAFFADSGRPARKYIRTACNKEITVLCNGVRYDLYTEILSEGGAYVRKEEPLPIGADVDVTLHLERSKTLQFKGKVIYTKQVSGDFSALPAGMAIQFSELSEQDHEDMSNHLKTLVAGDIMEEQPEKVLEQWEK
jgi:CheY-like chemotaxis protein/Tfp pilus assembly protein PilZ